jgi:anti-sigma-K factor RskA
MNDIDKTLNRVSEMVKWVGAISVVVVAVLYTGRRLESDEAQTRAIEAMRVEIAKLPDLAGEQKVLNERVKNIEQRLGAIEARINGLRP